MATGKLCPYCGEPLKYTGIDADIDTVTEEWYCDNCQEFVYFDEPGLRSSAEPAGGIDKRISNDREGK